MGSPAPASCIMVGASGGGGVVGPVIAAGEVAGAEFGGGGVADQGAAFAVVAVGEEGFERDVRDVAVEGLTVGEGEFGGFGDGVDEVGAEAGPWRRCRCVSGGRAVGGRRGLGTRGRI